MFIYITQKFIIIYMRFTQAKLKTVLKEMYPLLNDVTEFADFTLIDEFYSETRHISHNYTLSSSVYLTHEYWY